MSRKAYEEALNRLKDINPNEEDRDAVLAALMTDELGEAHRPQERGDSTGSETSHWAEKLANHWNFSLQRITDVVDVNTEEDDVLVLHQADGSNADAQRDLAKVYLAIKRLCFGEKRCSSTELGNFMTEQGVNDGHVGENIAKDDAILKSGVGKATKYGITPAGMKEAEELVKSWSE